MKKINQQFFYPLILLIFFQFAFTYLYLHKFSAYGYEPLKYFLIVLACVTFFLCLMAFSKLSCKIFSSLTVFIFLLWELSFKFTNHISALLVNIFFLHHNYYLFWSVVICFILFLVSFFWEDKNKRILVVYGSSLIVMGVFFLNILMKLSLDYLRNSYQIYPVSKIAQQQQIKGGYYLPSNAEYQYKMSLLKIRKPEIIALGTSRVLGLRQFMFNVPFVNMGRTFGGLKMLSTIKDILRIHKPKIILWGIDWWDFIRTSRKEWPKNHYNGTEVIFPQLLMPYEWIFQGKVSLTQFLDVALKGTAKGIDNSSFGVPARHHVEGYAKDGSIYYFSALRALISNDYKFENTIHTILDNNPNSGYFKIGAHIPKDKWVELQKLKDMLNKQGVILISYLVPEPPQIIVAMKQSHHYGYITELQNSSSQLDPYFYDYFDPQKLGSSACEFIDDLHSGDVLSMRVLLALSKDHSNGIYKYINKKRLQRLVQKYAGRASIPIVHDKNSIHEADYLGLGCKKGSDHLNDDYII